MRFSGFSGVVFWLFPEFTHTGVTPATPVKQHRCNAVIDLKTGEPQTLTANWQGHAKAAVTALSRLGHLPAPILAAAQVQGYGNNKPSERVPRVACKGSIYLVQKNITSELGEHWFIFACKKTAACRHSRAGGNPLQ